MASLVAQTVKRLPVMQETWVRPDPWVGKIPREGNGNALQYCCLENSMDGVDCRLQSMGSQSRTRLSTFTYSGSLV